MGTATLIKLWRREDPSARSTFAISLIISHYDPIIIHMENITET